MKEIRIIFSQDAKKVYEYLNKEAATSKNERTLLKAIKQKIEFIKENPQLGYTIKEVIGTQQIAYLSEVMTTPNLDSIVIGPNAYQIPEIRDIFYKALGQKINFYSLATFYERLTGRVPLDAIDQIWFLENLSEGNKRALQ